MSDLARLTAIGGPRVLRLHEVRRASGVDTINHASLLCDILMQNHAGGPLPTAQAMTRHLLVRKIRAAAGAALVLEASEFAEVRIAVGSRLWTAFGDDEFAFVQAIMNADHADPTALPADAAPLAGDRTR